MIADRLYLILAFFSLSLQVDGQIVTVRAAFDADSVMLGEQLTYTISAESAEDVMIGLPVYSDTLSKEIEILEVSDIDTTFRDDRIIISQEYLVAAFEPGWNTIPPQPVTFQTTGIADTAYTTALLLTVLAPDVDADQPFRPIKPPQNTPVSLAEILPWLLTGYAVLLLLSLIVIAVWYYLKREKHPELFAAVPQEPAHLVAFRELRRLEEDALTKKGLIKEYYSRLTGIIRTYITRQFSIHAMESTSSEILEAFAIQNTGDRKLVEMLESLLMLADLVKFAKEDPTREENETHLRNAFDFVERTYRMFWTGEEEADILREGDELGEADQPTGAVDDRPTSDVEHVKTEENNG
ncbi:MAG: cell wall anchor protein [Bacteroidales bacterium]